MKSKKILALICVLVLVLTGCGGKSGGDSAEVDKSKLVIAIQEEIEGTDIQQIGWENVVHTLTYAPLVYYNDDLSELQPYFAESFEISKDGKDITFKIPADSKFSNGDPLTSESVKASVMRMKEISEYAGDVEAIKDIEIVDDTTFIYHLSEPAPYMWASLTSTYGGIVDVDVANEVGKDEFNRAAVTNGPYFVKEWKAGSEVVLEKNPNFKTAFPGVDNKGVLNFDTIVVRFIPDEFTRVSELEAGNVDLIFDVPSASLDSIKGNADLTTYEYEQAGVTYAYVQTSKGPLKDKKVREAINCGLDREALAENMNGVVKPMYGFISAAQAGYSADKEAELAEKYKYDPEKAKALLKEAGYEDKDGDGFVEKDGKKLTIEYNSPTDKAMGKASAPIVQEQMKSIGIDLQIKEYEAAYIKQLNRDNDYDISYRNYVWNDADILYYVFTEASGYPFNDAKVTKALEDARYITDPAKRIERYEDFHDAMFDVVPAVSLFAEKYNLASTNHVKGLRVTNDGRVIFNDVTKE